MTEETLTKELYKAFSIAWPTSYSAAAFEALRDKAHNSGDERIEALARARLASYAKDYDTADSLLGSYLTGDAPDTLALLMRGRINSVDRKNYEAAIEDCDFVLKREKTDGLESILTVSLALLTKGYALWKMERTEEAINTCDYVIEKFVAREEPEIMEQVAKALYNKGIYLYEMDRKEEAIKTYDYVIEKFGEREEPEIMKQVAKALYNKGVSLYEMDRKEEAIKTYDDVIEKFGEREEPEIMEQVAKALYNKGVCLYEMGRKEEAIKTCDYVIEKFGAREEPEIMDPVAKAFIYKGVCLYEMDRYDEAIKTYDDVIKKFGARKEPEIMEQVAKSLVSKGVYLWRKDRHDDEIKIYDDVIEKYGTRKEPGIMEMVARAIYYSYLTLQKSNEEAAKKRLSKVYELFEGVEAGQDSFVSLVMSQAAAILGDEYKNEETAKKGTSKTTEDNLMVFLSSLKEAIPPEKEAEYFGIIEMSKEHTDRFINEESKFTAEGSFLLVLREWNSYTPALPAEEESDRGGGYFMRHGGEGIVIDPGYDFIENFERAGGRLCDIQHIVVTHAHDDHTANFESILMLFHRMRKDAESAAENGDAAASVHRRKNAKLCLYMAASVQRKFSGWLDIKEKMIDRIVTLIQPRKGEKQEIRLNGKTKLTVLPAYHDDVISANLAVGLCFDLETASGGERRIIFTGDTGLYPKLLDKDGKEKPYAYEDRKGRKLSEPEIDKNKENALYNRYREVLGNENEKRPDLLVAHIGAIKEKELRPGGKESGTEFDREVMRRFYVNHLGLLGATVLLYEICPEAAIISEFGVEMKNFRIELVDIMHRALNDKMAYDVEGKGEDPKKIFVIPGDITMVYDIESGRFLCHDDCEFKDSGVLEVKAGIYCFKEVDTNSGKITAKTNKNEYDRAYLFNKDSDKTKKEENRCAQDFFEKLFNKELPIHKPHEGK